MYDPGRRKIRKFLKQYVCFFISAKLTITASSWKAARLLLQARTESSRVPHIMRNPPYDKSCTFKTGYQRQLLAFQAQPGRRKTAFVIHGIFFFLWLDTVTAPVGRKDHKSNVGFRKALLAGNKFRKYKDIGIFCRGIARSEEAACSVRTSSTRLSARSFPR